jgi:diguanylate cyclase (GGDEF)-like protein/PAS domain S-box-containing protein
MPALDDLHTRLPVPWRYGLAVALFIAGLTLRFAILPVDAGLVYLTFYWVVLGGFFLCGRGPGVLVAALSGMAGYYFFTPPYSTFAFNPDAVVSLAVFAATSALIGLIIDKLQTTRARMQEAIEIARLSRQRYQGMVEDQTDLVSRLMADGTFIYANAAYCRYFGSSADALIGTTWHPVVPAEDIPLIEYKLATLSAENPMVTIENRVVTGDGSLRWAQFVNRAFYDKDGRLLEIQSVGRDVTERKTLETQLAESLARLQDLYDHAPCAYYSLSPDGLFVQINEIGLTWLGLAREEVVDRLGLLDFLTAEGKALFRQTFPTLKAEGTVRDLAFDLISHDGEVRHVSVSATAVKDDDGRFLMSRSVMYDVTELTMARNALQKLMREQDVMLDNDLVGIVKVRNRCIIWANKAACRIFGYRGAELIGQPTRLLYPSDAVYESIGDQVYRDTEGRGVFRGQQELVARDGRTVWVDAGGTCISAENDEWMWALADITALREHQDTVEHMAVHDPLTGLPNRRLLTDRLTQAVALAQRTQRPLVICYLDLDGFKPVNDRWGHAAGDALLKEVAIRLQACVRTNDTVCRLGGDEFVLMLTNLERVEEHEAVLARVGTELARPFALGAGHWASISASIGVTLFPEDGGDPDTLLSHADEAMYRAKALGRNRVQRYSPAA